MHGQSRMRRLDEEPAHLLVAFARDRAAMARATGFSELRSKAKAGADVAATLEAVDAIHPADEGEAHDRPNTGRFLETFEELVRVRQLGELFLEPENALGQFSDRTDQWLENLAQLLRRSVLREP